MSADPSRSQPASQPDVAETVAFDRLPADAGRAGYGDRYAEDSVDYPTSASAQDWAAGVSRPRGPRMRRTASPSKCRRPRPPHVGAEDTCGHQVGPCVVSREGLEEPSAVHRQRSERGGRWGG